MVVSYFHSYYNVKLKVTAADAKCFYRFILACEVFPCGYILTSHYAITVQYLADALLQRDLYIIW